MNAGLAATAGRGVHSAQPYPWPYHGAFDGAQCALVACVDGRWRAARRESEDSDASLVRLGAALRERGALIILVTATPGRVRGPLETDAPAVTRPPGGLNADVELAAAATNAFHGSSLDDVLRSHGRRDIVLAGWGLEGPVHSTMRAANDRGYECLLVPDACTPIEPELAFAACEMVRFSGGIFGAFADTAEVLQCLAAPHRSGAEHEHTR